MGHMAADNPRTIVFYKCTPVGKLRKLMAMRLRLNARWRPPTVKRTRHYTGTNRPSSRLSLRKPSQ